MFTNPYREMCVNILEKLLPRRAVQDSTLLQAYATFHMMKEVTLSGANYAEIYRAASRKSAPYLYALLADFAALKMPFPEDFVLMFDVQLDYFLRCVTPSLVADLRSFHRFFEEYGAPNRGIALRNVNSRIRLMFGENYGLHIFSAVGVGTECCVTLPLLFQEA